MHDHLVLEHLLRATPAMREASASWDICDIGTSSVLNGMKSYYTRMMGLYDNEFNTALFVRSNSNLTKDPGNPELWKGKTTKSYGLLRC